MLRILQRRSRSFTRRPNCSPSNSKTAHWPWNSPPPLPAEAVLQLARRPSGPFLAGGHPADFDFDDKTLRVRLKIPQGKGPGDLIRVALAIEAPEHSAFFEDAKRLVIGRANTIATSYSSKELADRSRLRLPEGFAATADPEVADGDRLCSGCAGQRGPRRLGQPGHRRGWRAAGPRAFATVPPGVGASGRSHSAALRRSRGSGRRAGHHSHRCHWRAYGGCQRAQQLSGDPNVLDRGHGRRDSNSCRPRPR